MTIRMVVPCWISTLLWKVDDLDFGIMIVGVDLVETNDKRFMFCLATNPNR